MCFGGGLIYREGSVCVANEFGFRWCFISFATPLLDEYVVLDV